MVKTKYLGIIAIASTTFLFSGCAPYHETFPNQHGYTQGYSNNSPRVNVSLFSYAYPYYYDRPYYFLNGLYYYGGYFSNGFYHYGNRRFRHGHYYNNGNRYYKGRRYRARNGVHGYYRNRHYYERSSNYRTKQRRENRGRMYQSRDTNTVRARSNHNVRQNVRSNNRYNKPRRSYIGTQNTRTIRSRDTYNNSGRSYMGGSRATSRAQQSSGTRSRSRPVR